MHKHFNSLQSQPHPRDYETTPYFLPQGYLTFKMAARVSAFEEILEEKPTLDELCEHIVIGIKWYQLGIQLKLDATQLDVIYEQNTDVTQKTAKMFQLWLNTNPLATRRHVLEALRKKVIGENNVANEYEKMLTSPRSFAGK